MNNQHPPSDDSNPKDELSRFLDRVFRKFEGAQNRNMETFLTGLHSANQAETPEQFHQTELIGARGSSIDRHIRRMAEAGTQSPIATPSRKELRKLSTHVEEWLLGPSAERKRERPKSPRRDVFGGPDNRDGQWE